MKQFFALAALVGFTMASSRADDYVENNYDTLDMNGNGIVTLYEAKKVIGFDLDLPVHGLTKDEAEGLMDLIAKAAKLNG